jgi:hypothetical protein
MLREARAKGFGLKVAIVGDVYDVPDRRLLFDPNAYASTLAATLFRTSTERLITVHPAGFGSANLEERAADAMSAVGTDANDVDMLVANAMQVVTRVTEAVGTPVGIPAGIELPKAPTESDDGPPVWVIAGGTIAIVLAGLGLTAFLARRRELG